MFDWNDIRHFLAVARTGSTLGAARELGVNQTTCARRIEALEAALGQRLFDRTRTGRTLTDAGRNLLPAAEAVEQAALAFDSAAASHGRKIAGTVRVTTTEVVANLWLSPALADFRRLYPDIRVELISGDRFLDLMKGEADVAIRSTGRPTEAGCVIRKLSTIAWAVYCSRDYAERRGAPRGIEDLSNHVVVGGADDLAFLPALQWLFRMAPTAEIHTRSNSLMNLFYSVRAGLGVAPLPVTLAESDSTMVRCSEVIPELESAVWLIAPEHLRDIPHVRAFMDFVAPYMAATRPQSGLEAL